ncbi:MAG: DegT/DnrJ/EryC1/StrS family aminotransferase [Clostridiales bacterium]|nr:DegT/DnrJ/EryC1/StrS family aminotransferase [Clostridiales bacterium]
MKINEFLRRYTECGALRLHTPGHKGKLNELDITELTDGSFPSPQLSEAEKKCAAAYKGRHARFLSCGSSQGVKAAILYSGCDGIIDVNSHRSVSDGYRLASKKYAAVGKRGVKPITVDDIKSALGNNVGAVVVTTPTYYGFCADIDGIKKLCADNGLLFIADSAHGAHYGFSPLLPKSAAGVADITNLSTHKTLFSLTQSAIIIDNLSDSESAKLSECVDIMGTTSPSYLLYSSIEDGVTEAADKRTERAYKALFDALEPVRCKYPFLHNDDFTRLVLDCAALNADTDKLNASLARHGVMSEMTDGKHIVFLFTAADRVEEVERFDRALHSAVKECVR